MIRYKAVKSSLETDKYFDAKYPWLIVLDDNGSIRMDRVFGKYPSKRSADREIRRMVSDWVGVHRRNSRMVGNL